MKNRYLLTALGLTLLGTAVSARAEETLKPDCTEVLSKLESDITKEPSRVLLAVEDALTTNEQCACEIIKTAISASKADPKLVGEIVSAGINAAPSAASTIGECALAASPEASKEIKKSMENALGQPGGDAGSGKEPVGSGKEPVASGKEVVTGKEVVAAPVAGPSEDFSGGPMDVHGIYLSSPSGGGGNGEETTIVKIIRTSKVRGKHKPRTGSTPATGS